MSWFIKMRVETLSIFLMMKTFKQPMKIPKAWQINSLKLRLNTEHLPIKKSKTIKKMINQSLKKWKLKMNFRSVPSKKLIRF